MKKILLTIAASALALNVSAVKLDWSYLVMPEEGEVTELREIQVMFPEIAEIEFNSKSDVTLSFNGSQISGAKVSLVDEQTFSVVPSEPLTAPGTYTLDIADGAICGYDEAYNSQDSSPMSMSWTIARGANDLDFQYESSLPTDEYLAYFGELTLTFPELESVTYAGSGLSVLKDGEGLADVDVTTDSNKLTLTLKEPFNFVNANVEVVIAANALTGTAAGVTAGNSTAIKIAYMMATPVEYKLGLGISNPKVNDAGEISANRSLESFFFVCEEKGLLAVPGTAANVTIQSEEGDFTASAHLRKASGGNANYSYFSASFGKEPSLNGKYTITIERGAFGTEAWLADPNYGLSNDAIELPFTLVDGADRDVYSITPIAIDPEEGTYKSGSALGKITLTFAGGVEPVGRPSATLAGFTSSYRTTVYLVAAGNGEYTATFSPAPSENGRYLLTVPGGAFADSANGKSSAPIGLTYLIDSESDIENIETSEAPATVYNMQGIRMETAPASLPAGLYIINGKKVMVK